MGDVGLTGRPPGGCLSTLAQAGRGKGLELALDFHKENTYCYLSDCKRYVISVSYMHKGESRQSKWFSPWFGAAVSEWQWSLSMDREVPETGHMRSIGGAQPDLQSAQAICHAHLRRLAAPDPKAPLPIVPAGRTGSASDQTPEGAPG